MQLATRDNIKLENIGYACFSMHPLKNLNVLVTEALGSTPKII